MSIQPLVKEKKPDLLCNFRAPSQKEYDEWQAYKEYVKAQGLDVCRVTIGLTNAFMAGVKGATQVLGQQQTVQIQMSNQFLYQVSKPRREPFSLESVKPEFRRTFSSLMVDAYILNKARELGNEFSCRHFLELNYDSFKRSIRRLKRKGKIVANPLPTKPVFYILTEKLQQQEPSKDRTE
jgi:hypothetical protein